tara:strand:+ start:564 stop:1163 length:600 start_codon:yes stop_codon:yes gene_type:complete
MMNTKASIARYYGEKKGPTSIDISNKMASIDWGEPSCWACGYDPVFHRNRTSLLGKLSYKKTDRDEYTVWNRAEFLVRAHVIPKALNGTDQNGNIILLCKTCHSHNPHSSSVKIYQAWFDNVKPYSAQMVEHIKDAFNTYNVTPDDYFLEVLHSQEFKDYVRDNWSNGPYGKPGTANSSAANGLVGLYSEFLHKKKLKN